MADWLLVPFSIGRKHHEADGHPTAEGTLPVAEGLMQCLLMGQRMYPPEPSPPPFLTTILPPSSQQQRLLVVFVYLEAFLALTDVTLSLHPYYVSPSS